MPEINIEILPGYYIKEDLEKCINNELLKILNTPINAYSSTEGHVTIPLGTIFEIQKIKKNNL